jgi:sialate O-acetylesterase
MTRAVFASSLLFLLLLGQAERVTAQKTTEPSTAPQPKAPGGAPSALTLATLFTDHAVLQRDMPLPIWGKNTPGEKITITFADQEKNAVADKDGRWMIKLDPLKASSEPRTLTVSTDTNKITRTDILVGEVWLCSGQSNMGFSLNGDDNAAETIKAAGDKELRLFNAQARATDEPQETMGGTWVLDSQQTAPGFSAVAYYFGKELRAKLGVPVGLIKSAVGGTVAEAWTPKADIAASPTLTPLFDKQAKAVEGYPVALENWKKKEAEVMAKHKEAVAKAKEENKPAPKAPQAPQDPAKSNNRPTGLYNGSIAPLHPYAIRGAIWYQGESNSGRGREYQTLFPAMIAGWRKLWGQGDFPFLFVQITPHQGMSPDIREAQRLTTETTQNTAMAVTIDVGHPTDIHPRQKQPIGQRLALAARNLAYGEELEYSGPTWDTISVDGNKATLTFKHLGGGLTAKDGDLKGFTIAGADGKYVDATAKIDGDTIVVSSDSVKEPVAVRYGWTNVPEINLWNKAGIPASPFQTDRVWKIESGFEPLFNGRDLTGWHYQGEPDLDGKQHATDGRYTARDGRIVVNPPKPKGLAQLWTTKEFPKDFVLRLEFRAGVNADSGVFIRKPQLQCRDYLVAGPYKELKNYKPQDWNEIEVTVKGDTATATCNGEPLKFDMKLPATGPIGLEADRGQMEYRRIRVKELN